MPARYEQKQSDPFYTSRPWRKVRCLALQRDGRTCQDCLREYHAGIRALRDINPAEMVHHIIPYQVDPSRGLDLDNLISLCDMHHERRHPERSHHRPSSAPDPLPFRVIKI